MSMVIEEVEVKVGVECEEIENMEVNEDKGEKERNELEGEGDWLEKEGEGVGMEEKEEGGWDVEDEGEGKENWDEKEETGDEEMASIEDDEIEVMIVVAITSVGKEGEENKEVLKEKEVVNSTGDEDIAISEDKAEVVNINDDIELFDTVINDELLKPFLMEKRRHHTKNHDNKK